MTDTDPDIAANPWDDPAFARSWNDTYGLTMERAPVRAGLVYPLLDKHIGDFTDRTLIDLGCGNGNVMAHFRDRAFTAWHGLDSGRAILDSAQAAIDDPRVQFTHIDIAGTNIHMPVGDIVTGIFVIEEIPDARLIDFFRNAARALKPDGKALFFTNHPVYGLLEDHKAVQTGGQNKKFDGHRGYFDTDPSQYTLSVMNGREGVETKLAYHHKPLGRIFKTAMTAGLTLTDMIEIPAGVTTLSGLALRTPQQGDFPRFLFLAFRPAT